MKLKRGKKNHLSSTSGRESDVRTWQFGKTQVDWPGWETIFSDRTHPLLRYLGRLPLGGRGDREDHGGGGLQEDALLQTTAEGTREWRSSDRKCYGFSGHQSLAACS